MRRVLVVDAANVVGSRPDGWWKDRVGATERLLRALAVAHDVGDRRIVVVEGRAVDAVDVDGVEVVRAPRDGDTTIVEVVASLSRDGVVVATSDRELARQVEALGAEVRGAGWLRDTLDGPR